MSVFKPKGSVENRYNRRKAKREAQTREEPVTYIGKSQPKPKRNKGVQRFKNL